MQSSALFLTSALSQCVGTSRDNAHCFHVAASNGHLHSEPRTGLLIVKLPRVGNIWPLQPSARAEAILSSDAMILVEEVWCAQYLRVAACSHVWKLVTDLRK